MKVLFVAQPFPYPPDTGSRNLIFHWLEAVSRAHDVNLLWLGDPAEGMDKIPQLPNVYIHAIDSRRAMGLGARVRRFMKAVSSRTPATSMVGMESKARDEILRAASSGD